MKRMLMGRPARLLGGVAVLALVSASCGPGRADLASPALLRGTYMGSCLADNGQAEGGLTLQLGPARRAALVPTLRGSARFEGGEGLKLRGSLSTLTGGASGACTLANRSGSSVVGLQFTVSDDGQTLTGRYARSNRQGDDLGRGVFTLIRR